MLLSTNKFWRLITSFVKNSWVYWLSLLVIIIIYLDAINNKKLELIKHVIGEKVIIFTGIISSQISDTIALTEEIKKFYSLKEENAALKSEKERLEQYYLKTRIFENENKHLKQLLHVVEQKDFKYKTAKIYYYIDNAFTKSIVIAGGKNEGIKKNQIVINNNGVVGRIIEVGDFYSKILLITDLNSRLPIISEKSNERGVIVGNELNGLNIEYLAEDNNIEVGELVFTSGEVENFPAGILIGVVSKKQGNEVRVAPAIDPKNLDYVVIIME